MITNKGALNDVLILDLTRFLAGPYCTMMLGDMGAQIIKVEQKENGDETRGMGPFINGDPNESGYFKSINRNKKGITLNLKSQKGKEVFLDLIKNVDVVVENFRPGTMEKLGLGWDILHEVNPSLIYGAISGFGHYGRYKDRAAFDLIGQAMGGIMSVTGFPDREPIRAGVAIGDMVSGISLSTGILAALHYRNKTGVGQKIDISIVDTLVSLMTVPMNSYNMAGTVVTSAGNRMPNTAYPSDSFKGGDGKYFVMSVANDKAWGSLCRVMDREDLISDERTYKNSLRAKNYEFVKEQIEKWAADKSCKDIVELLMKAKIAAAEIFTIPQVAEDPHIAGDREMFIDVEYPRVGKIRVTNSHYKMSETMPQFYMPSPDLGEHNKEIYGGFLGYSDEKIEELISEGAI